MPWKRSKCIIPCCQAKIDTCSERRFFRFPKKGTDKYERWVQILGREVGELIKDRKQSLICSIHFEAACIGKKFLKPFAVPTLYLKEESILVDTSSIHVVRNESHNEESCDLTIEELNRAAQILEKLEPEQPDEVDNPLCTECIKSFKKMKYYTRTIQNLKNKVKQLRKINTVLKQRGKLLTRKVVHLKNRVNTFKTNSSTNKMIDSTSAPENSKTFAKMILNVREERHYNENEKWICQSIFFRSSAGYNFLRENLKFQLPCVSSLHNWIKIKSLSPGCHLEVVDEIRKQTMKLDAYEKEVVIAFDEMSIQECLTYDKFKDEIYEFVDYGEEKCNDYAKSVCVFMLRSICGQFNQILYYVASPGSIPADRLEKEVRKCIDICEKLEVNVVGVTCDQGPTNRRFFHSQEITHEKPYFYHNEKKIHGLYDVPHLFKSFRNNLIKDNLNTPDGIISWEVIAFLYSSEKNQTTKICPKLSHAHIYPTNFQKMSVRLAVQVFNHSVASGIRALLALNKYPEQLQEIAISTANFIEKFNKLFDLLTCCKYLIIPLIARFLL